MSLRSLVVRNRVVVAFALLVLLGGAPGLSADGDTNDSEVASLLGKWRIASLIETSNIRPTPHAEAAKLIGSTLTFTKTAAARGDGPLFEVQYRVRRLSKDEFQQEYRTPWGQLGFGASKTMAVEIFGKLTNRRWEGLGSTLFVSNQSAPIVYYQGSYYKLTKLPSNG